MATRRTSDRFGWIVGAEMRRCLLKSWAMAVSCARRHSSEIGGLRSSSVIPRCTRHHRGCGCARGAVRVFHTNHDKTSMSREFDAYRRALGAIPWQDEDSVEIVR